MMRTSSFLIFLIIAALLAGFVGALAYFTFQPPTINGGKASPMAIGEALPPVIQSPTRPVIGSTDPVRGDQSAKLTIVEFGDFFCDACAEVETVLNSVLAQYPGRVKLVWKDFPNTARHPLAQKAAEAARCAQAQGKFWEYHDRLLTITGSSVSGAPETELPNIARKLGLNTNQFSECLTSGAMAKTVERNFNEGLLLRVNATPYFFVNNSRLVGAISEQALKERLAL